MNTHNTKQKRKKAFLSSERTDRGDNDICELVGKGYSFSVGNPLPKQEAGEREKRYTKQKEKRKKA